jgi:hypothetical protein
MIPISTNRHVHTTHERLAPSQSDLRSRLHIPLPSHLRLTFACRLQNSSSIPQVLDDLAKVRPVITDLRCILAATSLGCFSRRVVFVAYIHCAGAATFAFAPRACVNLVLVRIRMGWGGSGWNIRSSDLWRTDRSRTGTRCCLLFDIQSSEKTHSQPCFVSDIDFYTFPFPR